MIKFMRKKVILIMLLCSVGVSYLFAASALVATLYHTDQDSTSVYSGTDALIRAYNAAANGDVISLSSGAFTACAVSKKLTIRGAGMQTDSLNNIRHTRLVGDFSIGSGVTLENIVCDEDVSLGRNVNSHYENIKLIKCKLRYLRTYRAGYIEYATVDDTEIIQCKISSLRVAGNAEFYNCVIKGFVDSYGEITRHELYNCIVNYTSVGFSEFYNSVLYTTATVDGNIPSLSSNSYVSHCLAIGANVFANIPAETDDLNWQVDAAVADVFESYHSDLSTWQNFSLKPEYQHLGIDSTDIGVYGGMAPFTPYNDIPKIKKFNVASKSTPEGKLRVEIEVTTPNNIQ